MCKLPCQFFITSCYNRFCIFDLRVREKVPFSTTVKYWLSQGASMVSLKLLLKTLWWSTFWLKLESERLENGKRNCHVLHVAVFLRSNYVKPYLKTWKAAVTQKCCSLSVIKHWYEKVKKKDFKLKNISNKLAQIYQNELGCCKTRSYSVQTTNVAKTSLALFYFAYVEHRT